jgi:hypothetical protein
MMLKFACGVFAGASIVGGCVLAESFLAVSVPTNGILFGYQVQKGAELICRDPTVWNEFLDGASYIVCGN